MELLQSLFTVTVGSLLLGAGLPLFFALGIRFCVPNKNKSSQQISGAQKIIGYICFAIPLLAILTGLLWLASERIYTIFGLSLFGVGE